MEFEGVLQKMQTEITDEVQYYMTMKDQDVHLNPFINQHITLRFLEYQCLGCSKNRKIYRQGYCYPCFFKRPETAEWVIRPELSTAHLDIEYRDLEYEKKIQLQPHIVYLAHTGDVKVGITRKTQVPSRWIDQGAHLALPILEVPNRYLSGVAEVALKEHISDRTNWRNMLCNHRKELDLIEIRDQIRDLIPEEVNAYFLEKEEIFSIKFPVLQYPEKVKSLNFKKESEMAGILKGIKGQYFIFDDDTVFNVRGNSGHVVEMKIG